MKIENMSMVYRFIRQNDFNPMSPGLAQEVIAYIECFHTATVWRWVALLCAIGACFGYLAGYVASVATPAAFFGGVSICLWWVQAYTVTTPAATIARAWIAQTRRFRSLFGRGAYEQLLQDQARSGETICVNCQFYPWLDELSDHSGNFRHLMTPDVCTVTVSTQPGDVRLLEKYHCANLFYDVATVMADRAVASLSGKIWPRFA